MGYGQEVYPSQELVLDNSTNNRKSKFCMKINQSGDAFTKSGECHSHD
ncbi:hypothetical protein GEW_01953 [Pasteurella multocida subsp. gallicida str. Anand1_poultry]|nr:hypothetical protein GEW_01953 [Pasteurella multocida subsp. gallicida str. Anand1_poultry]